jgi:hypothetical protein
MIDTRSERLRILAQHLAHANDGVNSAPSGRIECAAVVAEQNTKRSLADAHCIVQHRNENGLQLAR